MDHDEKAIIDGLRHGDNWAYKKLYDCHYVLLCKIAFAFLKDDFLAQTIVDDLIIHIFEKRETLIITTSLRSYLVRSVRNRSLNYLQLTYKKKVVNFSEMNVADDWLLSIPDTNDYPHDALIENELEQEIHQSIERLPAECRMILEKSRFDEKKYEDIAAEMNISVNTVKYHIKNALAHLRKDLGKYL
jgi:RNA polymerase sigma-70 factor (ECF subfamily)